MKHLNGRCVVFGRIVGVKNHCKPLKKYLHFVVPLPARAITIDACGIIDETGKEHYSKPIIRSDASLDDETAALVG